MASSVVRLRLWIGKAAYSCGLRRYIGSQKNRTKSLMSTFAVFFRDQLVESLLTIADRTLTLEIV